MEIMCHQLKKRYFALLVPALAGFVMAYSNQSLHYFNANPFFSETMAIAWLFPLALILAVAGPIWLRAYFAHQVQYQKRVSPQTLLQFEHRLLWIVLATPYLALIAYLFCKQSFYLGGTVLAALYGIYYCYPSTRRIALDYRIFRVSQ